MFHANGKQKNVGVGTLISEKIDLEIKMIARDKEGHYIMIKRSIQEEDTLIVNIYTPYTHYFMGNIWGDSGNSVRLSFWGPKITADGDCSHEIKIFLLLGRQVMTNLDSILKIRDIALPTKLCLVNAMVFQWSCMDVRVEL